MPCSSATRAALRKEQRGMSQRQSKPSFIGVPATMTNGDGKSRREIEGRRPVQKIDAQTFYSEYRGHPLTDLRALTQSVPKPTTWLVGDSTLDNKYWIPGQQLPHPCSHHAELLTAAFCKRDVAYWLNSVNASHTTVNCAIEGSTLRQRQHGLLAHDRLVADSIGADDVLVVSVGGNDIALAPTLRTVLAVLGNVFLGGDVGMSHLRQLFRDDIAQYVQRITANTTPRLVIVCMVYFPCESRAQSWAGWVLAALGYNRRPQMLQQSVRRVYDRAVSQVTVDGVSLVTVPFFEVLNGKCRDDYVARVEPSEQGGRKMALQIMRCIEDSG